jgi:hypothetical protein
VNGPARPGSHQSDVHHGVPDGDRRSSLSRTSEVMGYDIVAELRRENLSKFYLVY